MYNFLIEHNAELSTNTLKNALNGLSNDGYTRYNIIQKIVKQLVRSGKKTNLDSMMEAIVLGDNQKFQLLIKKVNKMDEKCLFFSAAFGSQESLNLILKKGMDVTAEDGDNNNLLTIAAKSGNVDVLKYLMPKFNLSGDDGYRALLAAISNNQSETSTILIKNKAKIASNTTDTLEGNMLSLACMNGNLGIVKLLVNNGYPKDGYNQALQMAAQYNRVEILRYLIRVKFDVNSSFNEETPLGTASFWGNIDCVKLLVLSGAHINGISTLATPLSKACFMGQTEVAKFLVENGADVNAQPTDITGQLPLQQAIMSGSLDIIKILVQHGAKIDESILSLAKNSGSVNILNYLKSQA
jgi:ankyrin repeat protein